ncbi:hypothetical protein B7L88_gp096 [Rhizobium phage RHEph10]|uniref:hypothetical protein n=1 Tax=Rhizobium phage RHEph10 TaxID=1220717 RepID=UPI0002AB5810|nr:hypothetical protein B7L88_gp096 [Rhizobium phage RHEph10]AGC36192.1 hypothetical protein RHEph10_gp149 [Rhizobium phage RHEph10]
MMPTAARQIRCSDYLSQCLTGTDSMPWVAIRQPDPRRPGSPAPHPRFPCPSYPSSFHSINID